MRLGARPPALDPFRRHSDSDEYLSPLETTAMTRASSSGRRSESRPRSRSRRSRDDYDSDLLYSRDSEVSEPLLRTVPVGWCDTFQGSCNIQFNSSM